MQVRGDALGFGHELGLNYTDTTGEVDAATGKANINKRIDITDPASAVTEEPGSSCRPGPMARVPCFSSPAP
jgi:hypothetical protein